MMKLAILMVLVATMVTVHAASLEGKSDLIKRLLNVLEEKEERSLDCSGCPSGKCMQYGGEVKDFQCLRKRDALLLQSPDKRYAKNCDDCKVSCAHIGEEQFQCLTSRDVFLLRASRILDDE